MVNILLNDIIGTIFGLTIILAPAIIGYKVRPKYSWVHVTLTYILMLFLLYFSGPLGPQKAILPGDPYSYYSTQFYQSTQLNIEIGYFIVGIAFIWSLISLRKKWYESRVLLYYELIVFTEFIVLIPLFSRFVMFERIQEALLILSR